MRRPCLTALLYTATLSTWPSGADALDQSLAACQAVALKFDNTCTNTAGSAPDGTWTPSTLSEPDAVVAVTCPTAGQVCPDGTAR